MTRAPKIGEILEDNQNRDAIHIAIAPIQAAERLRPGQRVGIDDGKASPNADLVVGIIDPFLTTPVNPGQWCYLFLFPGTITNMWHEWEHPELPAATPRVVPGDRAASEAWLRAYVERTCPYYENSATALDLFIDNVEDSNIHYSGCGLHGRDECEDLDDLFRHLSVYLGRTVVPDGFSFTCSC